MKIKKTFAVFAGLLLFIPGPFAEALSLEALLHPEQQAALLSGETLREIQFKDPRPRLVPNHALVQRLIQDT
ncbi:MAG: hypothetical protein LBU18_05550, partial [Treponema sp.]|nr:hypothetical protein [Treponema sp.]